MLKPAYARLVSIIFHSRASLALSLCLVMGALTLAIIPVTRGERFARTQNATASAALRSTSFLKSAAPNKRGASAANAAAMFEPAAASACVMPGIVVQTDASGDELGDPTTSQLDLTSVSIAEPYLAADDQSITFTVKVNNLTGGPQTNSTWAVYMNVADTNGTARTMFVDMNTVDSGTGTVGYNYGYDDGNSTTSQGAGSTITGSFNEDGTIILKLSTASLLSFNDITGAHQFDIDLRGAGKHLTAIQGSTQVFVGALGDGGSQTIAATESGTGPYTTVGNASCNTGGTPTPTPSATPTATPISTPPPTGNTPQYTN